jgi:hypothetical protein
MTVAELIKHLQAVPEEFKDREVYAGPAFRFEITDVVSLANMDDTPSHVVLELMNDNFWHEDVKEVF